MLNNNMLFFSLWLVQDSRVCHLVLYFIHHECFKRDFIQAAPGCGMEDGSWISDYAARDVAQIRLIGDTGLYIMWGLQCTAVQLVTSPGCSAVQCSS
jgi:hypothetical protein